MKKHLLLFVLLVYSTTYGQNGFFIQPVVCAGITATSVARNEFYYKDEAKSGFDLQLLTGYRYHNFIFRTGITYFKSGYTGPVYLDYFSETVTLQYQSFYYLTIPVSFGYNFNISPRFSIVPALGYASGFKIQKESSLIYTPYQPSTSSMSSTPLYYMETKAASGTNSFASIQVDLEYKINSKFTITAGPEAQYKFSPSFPDNTDFFRPYTYTFNAGLKYCLSKKRNEVKPLQ